MDDGGVIKVPVGAHTVPPGTRTLLLERDGRYGTYLWYAEVMPEWQCIDGCWTNVQVYKLTVKDGILANVTVLIPQCRDTLHEEFPRLRVRFPEARANRKGDREYLHRIVAYAFPPGGGPRERFGDYAEFVRAGFQGDHLVDSDLVARPSLAIAGWVDPVQRTEHHERERARSALRVAMQRAEEVRRREVRGPAALYRIQNELRGFDGAPKTRKRRREFRALQEQAKRLKAAVAESRALSTLALSFDIDEKNDAGGGKADWDESDHGAWLFVECTRAQEWATHDHRRAALFACCARHDLIKLAARV